MGQGSSPSSVALRYAPPHAYFIDMCMQDCLFFLQLYTDKKGFTVFHCAKIAVMKNSQFSIVLMNCPRLVTLLKEETSFIFI